MNHNSLARSLGRSFVQSAVFPQIHSWNTSLAHWITQSIELDGGRACRTPRNPAQTMCERTTEAPPTQGTAWCDGGHGKDIYQLSTATQTQRAVAALLVRACNVSSTLPTTQQQRCMSRMQMHGSWGNAATVAVADTVTEHLHEGRSQKQKAGNPGKCEAHLLR